VYFVEFGHVVSHDMAHHAQSKSRPGVPMTRNNG
jgi:hypothetical protein